MNFIKLILIGTIALSAFTACSGNKGTPGADSKLAALSALIMSKLTTAGTQKVVSEDGKPVANAQILIGAGADTPFKGNLITTDQNGQFTTPAGWSSAQPVTISAPGFVRATYLSQVASGQSFTIHKGATHGIYELTGETTGIEPVEHGIADYAIVIPAIQKADLFHFNLGMIISPEMDIITILGQKIKLPSNVTLPTQHQSYFLPFTLSKPNYRNYFSTTGPQKVLALHGQFPFKKVVDKIRAKIPFYEVVNDMTIVGGGLADVNITGGTQNLDIDATTLSFSDHRTVSSGAVNDGEILFGIALAEMQGYLVPTDVKNLAAQDQNSLQIESNSTMQVLSILKKQSEMKGGHGEDRISAVVVPFVDGVRPQHLPLLADPASATKTNLQIEKLAVPAGLVALGTYASLQTLSTQSIAGKATKIASQVWEVYAPEWIDSVQVPAWPGESPTASGSMRWSIALVAGPQKPSIDLGPSLMQAVTHVTNVSVDF
jgi:hypothetical protein